jgi:hypothetical protein
MGEPIRVQKTAVVALALIVAPVAKADVAETFNLSGYFSSFFGSVANFAADGVPV